MGKIKHIIRNGDVFNQLTAVEPSMRAGYWRFCCSCGIEREMNMYSIIKGATKSCGCLKGSFISNSKTNHGHAAMYGGKKPSAEYKTWTRMRERCLTPTHVDYNNYGGRGIKVCERWNDFVSFLEDLGPKPSKNHSLERRNVNGAYEPENCHWADPIEQARNRRNTLMVKIDEKWRPLIEVANQLSLTMKCARYRFRNEIKRLGELTQTSSP